MKQAALALCLVLLKSHAAACPMPDGANSDPGVLVVEVEGGRTRLGVAELDNLPAATLTQHQRVSGSAASAPERSVTWSGVLLRDVVARSLPGGEADRRWRTAIVELVATDGYRAVFSWGELFNSVLGNEVIVVRAVDGRPLDAYAGPLALRSLADLRPGPRHVRNLCGVLVRRQ